MKLKLLAICFVAAAVLVAANDDHHHHDDDLHHHYLQKAHWHRERAKWHEGFATKRHKAAAWHADRVAYHNAMAAQASTSRGKHLKKYRYHKAKAEFHTKEAQSAAEGAKAHEQAFRYHTEQAIANEKAAQLSTEQSKTSEASSVDHNVKKKEAATAQVQFQNMAAQETAKANYHQGQANTLNNMVKNHDTQAIASYTTYKTHSEQANVDKTERDRQNEMAKNFYRLYREFKRNAGTSYSQALSEKQAAQVAANGAATHKAEADKYTIVVNKERSDEAAMSKKSSDESIRAQQYLAEMNVNKQKQQDHIQAKILNKKEMINLKQQYDTAVQKAKEFTTLQSQHQLAAFQASNDARRYNRATGRYRKMQQRHYDEYTRLKALSDSEKQSRDNAQAQSSALTTQANSLQQTASKLKAKAAEEHTSDVDNHRMAEERKAKAAAETKLADDLESEAKNLDAKAVDATSQAKAMSALASNERAKQKSAEQGAESHEKTLKDLKDKIHDLDESIRGLTTSIRSKVANARQHKAQADEYGQRAAESSKMEKHFTELATKHKTIADNSKASARAHRQEATKLVDLIAKNAELAKKHHLKKQTYHKQAVEVLGQYKAETDSSNKAKDAEALHKQAASSAHESVRQMKDELAKDESKIKQEQELTTKLHADAGATSDKAKVFFSKYSRHLARSKALKAAADSDEALAAKAKGEADTHTQTSHSANKQSESHTLESINFEKQQKEAAEAAALHTTKRVYHSKRKVVATQEASEAGQSAEQHHRRHINWNARAARMSAKVDANQAGQKQESNLSAFHHGRYQHHWARYQAREAKKQALAKEIHDLQETAKNHRVEAHKEKEAKNANEVQGNSNRVLAIQALAHRGVHASNAEYHKTMADYHLNQLASS